MFGKVPTSPKRVEEYRPIVGNKVIDELERLAKPFAGARMLDLSVTAFGTGVAEMLNVVVPMMYDLDICCEWHVIRSAEDFIIANKAIYDALGGKFVDWTAEMYKTWLKYNDLNAKLLDEQYDFIIVHDPQPAGLISAVERLGKRSFGKHWIWHSHLDLSAAQPDIWDVLRPSVERYDAAVFDMAEYAPNDVKVPLVAIINPAIDPLHPKNMIKVSDETVRTVLGRFDVDANRPVISQVSPFDQWHDPLALIDIYREVKMRVVGLQLVLVALMTPGDPEARTYFELATERAGDEADIHVLSSLNDIGNLEVNVLQRAAHVVVQRSLGKEFGIMASEAMWKERPVIAARGGGIPSQIIDGQTGYVVDDDKGFVERLVYLLENPRLADEMGRRAKEHVRHHFLVTRQVKDYLTLFSRLEGGA